LEDPDDSAVLRIQTPRLELIAATAPLARADAAYDHASLARQLSAEIPSSWPPELTRDVLEFFAQMAERAPEQTGWWTWFIVRCADPTNVGRTLIGGAGFKGPPNDAGEVEVGYSILPGYQRLGYATEAVTALIAWSVQHGAVQRVVAHTLLDGHASQRVLTKLGFTHAGPGAESGTIRHVLVRGDNR
jgi:[ribosomal protein S5]-alanine N-acetyltransferase